jgi:uncharacterized protein
MRLSSACVPAAADIPRKGGGRASAAGFAILLFGICCVIATAALALTFPQLTGRVVDEASILNATTRAELTRKLADLEAKTTDQFVVVTLKSLQGTSIEDFGVQLGRHWQIGQKGKNNGVLLIVAPNERRVRIEVGYGLEGKLPDAITKLVIEGSIIPRFRANDFPGGITRGVDDIIQILTGDASEWQRRTIRERPESRTSPGEGIFMLFFITIAGFIVFSVLGGLFQILHSILAAMGVVQKKPKKGFWYWVNQMPSGGGSSGSSSSGGSSSGGFSGGGGSFGGGGSSGSW